MSEAGEKLPAPPSEQQPDDEPEMDFWDHVGELRKRLIISILAVGVCSIFGWYLSEAIFQFLTAPFAHEFKDATLIGTGPAEAFVLRLKVAVFAGALIASPILFLQLWLFIAPGLHDHEKQLALPFVGGTTLLFLLGVSFCYYAVLPFALEFFRLQYEALGEVVPTIRISEYLGLLIKVALGFGIIFELPILSLFLGHLGLITSATLINSGRYAIVAIFIISAILTPPDPLTQILMAVPLCLLYGLSILVVRFMEKKRGDEL